MSNHGHATSGGWTFRTIYRCARFDIGCQQIPDASPPQAPWPPPGHQLAAASRNPPILCPALGNNAINHGPAGGFRHLAASGAARGQTASRGRAR